MGKIQRFGGHDNLDPGSDLDSSDSEGGSGLTGRGKRKGRHSRRGRGEDDEDYMEDEREIEYGMWSKGELFKLEKAFLAFGWGRWEDMVQVSGLRGKYSKESAQDAIRLILLYCVNTYRGDEKLRNFTWELITPAEYAENQALAKRKKVKRKIKKLQKTDKCPELNGFRMKNMIWKQIWTKIIENIWTDTITKFFCESKCLV